MNKQQVIDAGISPDHIKEGTIQLSQLFTDAADTDLYSYLFNLFFNDTDTGEYSTLTLNYYMTAAENDTITILTWIEGTD